PATSAFESTAPSPAGTIIGHASAHLPHVVHASSTSVFMRAVTASMYCSRPIATAITPCRTNLSAQDCGYFDFNLCTWHNQRRDLHQGGGRPRQTEDRTSHGIDLRPIADGSQKDCHLQNIGKTRAYMLKRVIDIAEHLLCLSGD